MRTTKCVLCNKKVAGTIKEDYICIDCRPLDIMFYKRYKGSDTVYYRRDGVWFIGWFGNQWGTAAVGEEELLQLAKSEGFREAPPHAGKFKSIKQAFEASPHVIQYIISGLVQINIPTFSKWCEVETGDTLDELKEKGWNRVQLAELYRNFMEYQDNYRGER